MVRPERDGGCGTGDGSVDRCCTSRRSRGLESGFEAERVSRYLEQNAGVIEAAKLNPPADAVAAEVAARLRALAVGLRAEPVQSLEELDRTLSVLEEKMFAALLTLGTRRRAGGIA